MLRRSHAARRAGGPSAAARPSAATPALRRRTPPLLTAPRRARRAAAAAAGDDGGDSEAASGSGRIDALLGSGRGGVLPLGGGDAIALPSRATDELWPSFAFDRETALRLQLEARARALLQPSGRRWLRVPPGRCGGARAAFLPSAAAAHPRPARARSRDRPPCT